MIKVYLEKLNILVPYFSGGLFVSSNLFFFFLLTLA